MRTQITISKDGSQTWTDLEGPTDQELADLQKEYNIESLYLQDVLQPEHLPKWEWAEEKDMYFAIGRFYDEQAAGKETIQQMTRKLAVFVQENHLITIHRSTVPFIEELKPRCSAKDSRYQTVFQVETKLFKEIFRSYEPLLYQISEEMDFYEGKVFGNRSLPPFIKGLFQLKRRISVVRKVILLSKTLVDCLRDQAESSPQVQDAHDMYLRMETLMDDLNERANNLINIHLALSDQRSNEVMRVLTVFSAFFLPVTFMVGVWGMNFKFMPELESPWGYPLALGSMAAVAAVIYGWFKRKGWLG